MYRRLIISMMMLLCWMSLHAQRIALENNLFMDAMASVNLGVELEVGERATVAIPGSFNFWDFSESAKFRHIAIQPEIRYWLDRAFDGHFFGFHTHYAFYNVGGIGPFTKLKENRYEGWLAGAGLSWGYNWMFAPRWGLEATVGVGYAYTEYDKYPCGKCQPASGHSTKHYFGPTKVALTLVFLIK